MYALTVIALAVLYMTVALAMERTNVPLRCPHDPTPNH